MNNVAAISEMLKTRPFLDKRDIVRWFWGSGPSDVCKVVIWMERVLVIEVESDRLGRGRLELYAVKGTDDAV